MLTCIVLYMYNVGIYARVLCGGHKTTLGVIAQVPYTLFL